MFAEIVLTVVLLLGIPIGVYGTFGALYLWGKNRRAGCAAGVSIIFAAIVYLIAWCYGLSVCISWWLAIANS
jgi:hypothetical protein